MRGGTARVVVSALIAMFVAEWAEAAGPQFTGLLNTYQEYSGYFIQTSNSLAKMDRDGAIAGTVVGLPASSGWWSDIVIAPNNSAWYGATHHDVFKINPANGVATKLVISTPGITDPSWIIGETWDSTHNRLVVATLGGVGYLFGYFDSSNQWNLINNLNNVDLRTIVHRPANDTIYALENVYQTPLTRLLKYNANGQPIGSVPLSQGLPFEQGTTDLDWQMLLASDGQLAVIAPSRIPPGTGTPGNWLYLINPDTGVVTYSAAFPVPEPAVAGLLAPGVLILRRRIRR